MSTCKAWGHPDRGADAVRAGHPERMEVIFREHMTSRRNSCWPCERPASAFCFEARPPDLSSPAGAARMIVT